MPQFPLGLCSVLDLGKLETRFFFAIDPFKLAKTRPILNSYITDKIH